MLFGFPPGRQISAVREALKEIIGSVQDDFSGTLVDQAIPRGYSGDWVEPCVRQIV